MDISLDRFQADLFMLAINLSVNPIAPNEPLITRDVKQRSLSPIDAGSIDVQLVLHERLQANSLVFFVGISDIIVSFDQNGIPRED